MAKLILFTLLFSWAFAQDIEIHRVDGKIFAEANSCEKLVAQYSALSQMSKIKRRANCSCELGSKCTVELGSVMPKIYKELLDRNLKYEGPNCWNAALLGAGSTKSIRYMDDSELKIILNSPICEKVSELRPGDIVTIKKRSSSGRVQELHGFTYLTSFGVFNKENGDASKPYTFANLDSVLKKYQVSLKCHLNESDCELYTEAHRCSKIDELFESKINHNLKKSLMSVSCILNKAFKGQEVVGSNNLSSITSVLDVMDYQISEMKHGDPAKEILIEKLSSLRKGIRDIQDMESGIKESGEVINFKDSDQNQFYPLGFSKSGEKYQYENYVNFGLLQIGQKKLNDYMVCEFLQFLQFKNKKLSEKEFKTIEANYGEVLRNCYGEE